jgi:putative tryptophan/tyrosine transport system substrate-binding protein
MKRREFFAALGSAAAWPLAARAQQPRLPQIGFLSASALGSYRRFIDSFHGGLNETGYVEGRNVTIQYGIAEDHAERLPELAADLVQRRVAVIATFSNVGAALAAKAATQTIPIVFLMGADPIRNGLVTNLARPDANITGVTLFAGELLQKRLTLLRELVPSAKRIAYLVNYTNPAFSEDGTRRVVIGAHAVGIELIPANMSTESDIDEAFMRLNQQQVGAVYISGDSFLLAQREHLVALAARFKLPASYFARDFVEVGGLMSYASNYTDMYRQAGTYVGRVLKGEKPGDLPVLQPTKFELVINLRTAKTLGIEVPQSILLRTDEVIE